MRRFHNYMINAYKTEINNIDAEIERERHMWAKEAERGVELWTSVCPEFLSEGVTGEGRIICGGAGKVCLVGAAAGGRRGVVGDTGAMEV